MRKLNSLMFALAVLPCCIIVVGCSNSKERIIGTWRNVHSSNNTITFIGDGTAMFTEGSKIQTVRWQLAENDKELHITPDLYGRDTKTTFDIKLEFQFGGTELRLLEKRSKFSEGYKRVYDLKSSDLAGVWKSGSDINIEIKPTNIPTSFKVVLKFEDGDSEYDGTLIGNRLHCKIIEEETGLKGEYKRIYEQYQRQFDINPIDKRTITGYMGWEFKK